MSYLYVSVEWNMVKPNIIITGVALSASFVSGAHFLFSIYQLELFALFLALTACVYGGAALTPVGGKFGRIELPFVMVVFTSSIFGLVVSPFWLAVGYFTTWWLGCASSHTKS